MAHADVDRPASSQAVPESPLVGLGGLIEAALVRVYGSKKAAAIELGKDRSHLRRQLALGTLIIRELDNPLVLAALGQVLMEEYGAQRKTKKQQAMERLPELLGLMLEAVTEGE